MTPRAWALDWAWDHPRWKRRAREAWAVLRGVGRRVHAGRLFEPPEFGDLRRLATSSTSVSSGGQRVLFLSFRGWSTHTVIEAVLGHAVARRGWDAVFVTCGGRLPICDVMPVHAAPPMPCRSCKEYAIGALEAAGFEAMTLSDGVDVAQAVAEARVRTANLTSVSACERFAVGDLALGQLVRTSVAWFLSRGSLTDDELVLRTYRSFLVSGLVVAEAFERILDRVKPDRVFALNGRFFAEAIITTIASKRGIGYTTYEKGFLRDSIITTPGADAANLLMPEEDGRRALEQPLTAAEEDQLDRYLAERRRGGATLDRIWTRPVDDVVRIRRDLGLGDGRPLVVMFCNILWDSAVVGMDLCFPSIGKWVVEGVDWARSHPELDLVVRLHPGEVRLGNHRTLERMVDYVRHEVPALPANVRIVPPESPVSSYALMDVARVGLVYTSTVGLEMAAQGTPVVVAGRTHYRGRGFTVDPVTAADYWRAVDHLLSTEMGGEMVQITREQARRYAFAFFFRFHHVTPGVQEEGHSRPRVVVTLASALDPGGDASLDRIVSDILSGGRLPAMAAVSQSPDGPEEPRHRGQ